MSASTALQRPTVKHERRQLSISAKTGMQASSFGPLASPIFARAPEGALRRPCDASAWGFGQKPPSRVMLLLFRACATNLWDVVMRHLLAPEGYRLESESTLLCFSAGLAHSSRLPQGPSGHLEWPRNACWCLTPIPHPRSVRARRKRRGSRWPFRHGPARGPYSPRPR